MSVKYENAHEIEKGDPRVDGPYLEDVRLAEKKLIEAVIATGDESLVDDEPEAQSEQAYSDLDSDPVAEKDQSPTKEENDDNGDSSPNVTL